MAVISSDYLRVGDVYVNKESVRDWASTSIVFYVDSYSMGYLLIINKRSGITYIEHNKDKEAFVWNIERMKAKKIE